MMYTPDRNPLAYNQDVEHIRELEYPSLKDAIYLDHAGSTVYARSLIQSYAMDLQLNLYGNPHSDNTPSRVSGARVDAIRVQLLRFFGASPEDFDLVFTANATASIKLVGECLSQYTSRGRAYSRRCGFHYVYHQDSHSSLVGLREIAAGGSMCLLGDAAVEDWLTSKTHQSKRVTLFAYPGQSNMTGRRLPLSWPGRVRRTHKNTYTLLDAAALASTSPLDLSDSESAPDFTAISLYKIFGYPDVGCLIVRKAAATVLQQRRYFGGGTVDMVINSPSSHIPAWHAIKTSSLHDALEDGTLNFHSIAAIPHAISTHTRLFTSMSAISSHCASLSLDLYTRLTTLRHSNNAPLCRIYTGLGSAQPPGFGDPALQGPTIALSVLDPAGKIHGYADVERQADKERIYLRSGSVCNPGGMAYLGWTGMEDMKAAWAAGHRCSNPIQEVRGQTTGVVRVSLGAMSTRGDIEGFVEWLARTYRDRDRDRDRDQDRDIEGDWEEKQRGSVCSLEGVKIRGGDGGRGRGVGLGLVKRARLLFCHGS
ncbi:pyridoxal phosphate-dependent transferase [Aspergillus egyptiacus]|nr:pyridoxal phosphate-dependent transferase [Aspergillus egyptiacus]